MTSSFKDLDRVCKALGLKYKQTKNGHMWAGLINGKYIRIEVHVHAGGRDVPTGTFNQYVKLLGFANVEEYRKFLNNL